MAPAAVNVDGNMPDTAFSPAAWTRPEDCLHRSVSDRHVRDLSGRKRTFVDSASSNSPGPEGHQERRLPLVSVIMVCRDGLPWLSATLESLERQTFIDWELVFWDNGSRDGSAEMVRALTPRARVLGGAEPLTLGEARGRAAEESRGRYLALLDADDLWRSDKLERQVERMSRGDVGLCYADCHVIAADGRRLGLYSRRVRPAQGRVRAALLAENCIATCTAMVAREAWSAVGGPDARLDVAADYELWLRMASVSDVAYDPEPLASYRVRPATLTGNVDKAYAENRQIYHKLLARADDGAPGERALARRALAFLLWKWVLLEILRGKGPGATIRRAREAWRAAHGPAQALADLSSCAVRTLKGIGLRIAMHREHRRQ